MTPGCGSAASPLGPCEGSTPVHLEPDLIAAVLAPGASLGEGASQDSDEDSDEAPEDSKVKSWKRTVFGCGALNCLASQQIIEKVFVNIL